MYKNIWLELCNVSIYCFYIHHNINHRLSTIGDSIQFEDVCCVKHLIDHTLRCREPHEVSNWLVELKYDSSTRTELSNETESSSWIESSHWTVCTVIYMLCIIFIINYTLYSINHILYTVHDIINYILWMILYILWLLICCSSWFN